MPQSNLQSSLFFDQTFYRTEVKNGEYTTDLKIITSRAITITQDEQISGDYVVLIPDTADVTIWADQATIRGPIKCPGKNFKLFCRVLASDKDTQKKPAEVNVTGESGKNAEDLPQPSAHSGVHGKDGYIRCIRSDDIPTTGGPGGQGIDGNDGYSGKNGGSIDIGLYTSQPKTHCKLTSYGGRGGNGSRGQNGGTGGKGGKGDDLTICLFGKAFAPQTGGKGGNGGNGGKGGNAAHGGAGGTITLTYFKDQPAVDPQADNGNNGRPGTGGKGGDGGAGGKGGKGGTYRPSPDVPPIEYPDAPYGRNGKPGDPGAQGSVKGPIPVTEGKIKIQKEANLSKIFPMTEDGKAFYSMLLERASDYYLAAGDDPRSSNLEEARTLVIFLNLAGNSFRKKDDRLPGGIPGKIFSEAGTLLRFMRNGQNRFGHHPSFVPTGSVKYWSHETSSTLQYLKTIDTLYKNYAKEGIDQDERREALRKVANDSRARINRLSRRRDALVIDLKKISHRIDQREKDVQVAGDALHERLEDLKDAIRSTIHINPADFATVLNDLIKLSKEDLSTFISLAKDVYNFADKSINDIHLDDGSVVKKKLLIRKLACQGREFTSMKDAFAIVKGGQIQVKLLANEGELEKLLQTIKSKSSEAAAKALRHYTDVVNSRNEIILAYNSVVSEILKAQASIDSEKTRAKLVESKISILDPGLPMFVNYVNGVYQELKKYFVSDLYHCIRAAAFWALDDRINMASVYGDIEPQPISQESAIAMLTKANEAMKTAHESLGQDMQDIGRIFLPIDAKTHPAAFAALRAGKQHQIPVTIPPAFSTTSTSKSPFSGWADVRATTVRAWFYGAKVSPEGDGRLMATIRHEGTETLISRDDKPFSANHQDIVVNFVYPATKPGEVKSIISDGTITHSDSQYSPVGPFTSWSIGIDPLHNPGLDLSGLEKITLEFLGKGYAFRSA